MTITPCKECGGRRLKKESLAVTIGGKNISELTEMSITDLNAFMDRLELTKQQHLTVIRSSRKYGQGWFFD